MLFHFIKTLSCSVLILSFSHAYAEAPDQAGQKESSQAESKVQENVHPEEVLLKARQTLEEAETLAIAIIEEARIEAQKIVDSKKMAEAKTINGDNLEVLQQEIVAVEFRDAQLLTILKQIMPIHWRIILDADDELQQQRFDFLAQKSRDEILRELTLSLGLRYHYFDRIKDKDGLPSPVLVVSPL